MIPYFGLIYAVLSAISCNSHTKQRVTLFPRPSNSFPSFPSLLLRLRRQPLLFACRCCRGNIFNEQHWNLVNIAFVVAKLGNICFESNICVREANMCLTSGKNIFCFRAAKFVSATCVSRAAKLEDICLTMFPQQCVHLDRPITWLSNPK